MRLFVTGGAGFIGSNFIRYWLEQHSDDSVLNFDLLTNAGTLSSVSDVERDHPGRYSFVQGDIAEASAVEPAINDFRPDILINFAAESHNSWAIVDPTRFVRTNVMGTQVLLEAARRAGVSRFHQISTCEVYGDLPLDSSQSFDESSPYRPQTPYNASKASADLAVRAYVNTFALPATISNCCNNYGPFQFPEKLIPLFTTNLLNDRPLTLYRHSENRREWIHVLDHCRALELILQKGRIGETYHVGTGVERSVEEVTDFLIAHLNKSPDSKTYVPDRPQHDRRYLLDSSKTTKELGWRPSVSFDDGLRSTIDWYRKNRWWWEPLRQRPSVAEDNWDSLTNGRRVIPVSPERMRA